MPTLILSLTPHGSTRREPNSAFAETFCDGLKLAITTLNLLLWVKRLGYIDTMLNQNY
jgi:hypothetical protein